MNSAGTAPDRPVLSSTRPHPGSTEPAEELRRLLQEEQSLRDVAALLASAGLAEDILTTICRAVSDQLDGQEVSLLRFDAEGYVVVATHGGPIPVGVRAVHTDGSLPHRVASTGGPVREDDFAAAPDAHLVAPFGIRAAVAVPVFVDGEVWGMFSASSQTGPLPAHIESRLSGFAQLTWAAVASTEARGSLKRLAEEQAAVRVLAEVVARESPLSSVFQAAAEGSAHVLNATSTVLRYDGDSDRTIVVARAGPQPNGDAHRFASPIMVEGQRWGTLEVVATTTIDPAGRGLLKPFADLTATAIASAHHREGLRQSRARVIAAADEARRRLQRDVHDGAQQRLVHAIITLKLARTLASGGGDAAELLAEALTNAEDANRQLRDIVRGILPASLTRSGLAAGIQALVAQISLPIDLDLRIPRLPSAVETTGYFTVAEAITNAVKHANATRLRVGGVLSDDGKELTITVQDDGIGGADPARGTGLLGLRDRIEASNGAITVVSPVHMGTRIIASIPIDGDTTNPSSSDNRVGA